MTEIFYGHNFLQESLAERKAKQKAANAERDIRIAQIEEMGEPVNIYDASLMSQLFGPKSMDDVKDMF
jgi:hypothetical protein